MPASPTPRYPDGMDAGTHQSRKAEKTELASYAANLCRDIDAVQAALDLPWTTSPVEGQINRLKLIKRSMYGRAGFDLLRNRVLNAA